MPKNKPDHPANSLVESELVENILCHADNPGECARCLTTQIRELLGVRMVALLSAETDSGPTLLSLCPPRNEADWSRPEIQEFVLGARAFPGPRLIDHLTDPTGQGLSAIGIGTSLVIPLMVGADRVGMLILLGLPEVTGGANILATLTRVARILALVLKDSLLHRDPEHTVAARTTELETTLERLQAELEQGKRIEAKLQVMQFSVDNTADAVFWVRPDGSYAYANKSACRMFGYGREEFLRLKTMALNPEHQGAAWKKHWDELREKGALRFETALLKKDRSPLLVEITANHIEFAGQEFNCAFVHDITERKRAAERLETERERMEVILSALNTGLSLINPDMTIAWANHKIREMFPGREPVGQVCHVFYESRATVCDGCGTIRAFMDGKVCESEQLVPATGRTYSIISQPIKDQTGRVVNVLEGITDITERLRAEEELRRSAREWSAAMDASEDVIYLLDLDRRVLRANKAFYRMTRSTPESAVARPIAELLHPGGVTVPCPHCQAQKEQREVVFTMEADHPHNPAGHPFEIALRMVRDDAGRPISMLKTWHDLTHERKVQAELTAYREHLEELVRVRTAEIEKKKREVERLNKLFVGRELRMIELKEQIQQLEARLAAERH